MVGLEVCKPAQGELVCSGIVGMGSRFGQPLGFGPLVLFAGFFPTLPGAELRIGLLEDKAHGHRDFRRHQEEQAQALAPDVATAFCITQLREIGELGGRC